MIRIKVADLDESVFKLVESIAKYGLLILDDFGSTNMDRQQQMALIEIMEDRPGRASTIIASQLQLVSWHKMVGQATLADAF